MTGIPTAPVDGVVYTPEDVSENRWLGALTPTAIRKACGRGEFEHTRIRNKIGMTRANILANQQAGLREVEPESKPAASPSSRRGRRTRVAAVPAAASEVAPLRPKPARARRRAS